MRAAFEEPLPPGELGKAEVDAQAELSLPDLIAEVQSRNPSLQAMAAAWQSAAERYPQAVSLDDPMFMAMVAPASFGSDLVDPGYSLEASQKFPWFGKRAARGRRAQAESQAAYHDLEDSRNRLEEMTRTAFFQYYLARRELDLNRENQDVIRQFQKTARSKYEANQVTQQDVLQAELESADLERRNLELVRMDRVAIARINTLLGKNPFCPLPPPPKQLATPTTQFDVAQLQELAISSRPDLAALRARVQAAAAAVTLADKNYYPDTEVFGKYDAMWQENPLKPAVGVNLNVPLYRGRLDGAALEARFTVNQRRAEYEQMVLDAQYEVAADYEQVNESHRVLQLYSDRLVPAAEQNVAAARSNYDVNKSSFLDLAIAERRLIEIREKREDALAAYHSRFAELTRAVGGVPVTGANHVEGKIDSASE
ncbi:MAG TPA: TolC family protein [Lacipirellulaceae bacterium]|nr:TolC family protein [Lacipirellulaceae bacterium]